jgi:hypothetical protein
VSATLVALLALAAPQYERGRALVDQGRFAEALQAFDAESDAARRAEGRAWAFYRGRLPAAALAEAEQGLARDPRDLALLHRAAAAGLFLRAPERAAAHLDELAAALAGAGPPDDARAFFAAEELRLRALLAEIRDEEARRSGALRRARGASLALLAAALAALLFLALRQVEQPAAELRVEQQR